MKMNYCFRTFKLILLILNVIYFIGVFWFLYCEIGDYFLNDDNFNSNYQLIKNDDTDNFSIIIKIMYYSFTTLSTVGFGDLHPINNRERLACAFLMFFGASIFSQVLSMFLEIIIAFKKIDEDIGN